jgi:hypothetical protein
MVDYIISIITNATHIFCIFQYEKLVLSKSQQIMKVEFTAEGRKIPLDQIRKKMLETHKPFLRAQCDNYYNNLSEQVLKGRLKELNELQKDLFSQEEMKEKLKTIEKTRHLLVWLDNSTVVNHGYLVCLITCLYNPAVFLTNDEYKLKTGQSLNVQKVVETPEVHFIARCGSSDSEQLMYSETRMQCIQGLKHNIKTSDNIEYIDKLRLCHGDSPLRAFEAGQQKGGNYFCSNCGVYYSMTYELDHVLNCPLISLQDRQDKVLNGIVARRKSLQHKPKPLKDLTKQELEQELGSRGIYDGQNKKQLQDLLTHKMCGMQRVPALLFNTPLASLTDLGLDKYEILPTS